MFKKQRCRQQDNKSTSTAANIAIVLFSYRDRSNKLQSVNIPDGVTHIGTWAFIGKGNDLKKVVIPSTVTYIGSQVFYVRGGGSVEVCIESPKTGGKRTMEEDAFLGVANLIEKERCNSLN